MRHLLGFEQRGTARGVRTRKLLSQSVINLVLVSSKCREKKNRGNCVILLHHSNPNDLSLTPHSRQNQIDLISQTSLALSPHVNLMESEDFESLQTSRAIIEFIVRKMKIPSKLIRSWITKSLCNCLRLDLMSCELKITAFFQGRIMDPFLSLKLLTDIYCIIMNLLLKLSQ